MYDIAVIGAGASGLLAAIFALKENRKLRVALFDGNDRVGKKILVTGNGRCNLTNTDLSIDRYHGEDVSFAETPLSEFGYRETVDFFESIGILTRVLEDGKVFPYSLQASSVLDMLRQSALSLGAIEITGFKCTDIKKNGTQFVITSNDGAKAEAKRVIIACGGKADPKCGTDGSSYSLLEGFSHKRTKIYPSLVQLKCNPKLVAPLKGVKVLANISIFVNDSYIKTESGEVLFTDYGISGPPVFQLSRIASVGVGEGNIVRVSIDLMSDMKEKEVFEHLLSRNKDVALDKFLTGLFAKQLSMALIKSVCSEKMTASAKCLDEKTLKKLAKLIKNFELEITGTNPFAQAQVTAGGIRTCDFDPKTMQSKLVSGIYACGEILDIDGDCGGFNLQWAWSSGAKAGKSCALSLK